MTIKAFTTFNSQRQQVRKMRPKAFTKDCWV